MKNYCEICEEKTYLDKHHILSRSKGGTNKKYNIAHICPTCHRLIHKGEIILEGRFLTSDGYILLYHYKDQESITNRNPDCYIM